MVEVATLERLYPGGVEGFAADCPNSTLCSDEVLTRVGFMAPADVGEFMERLKAAGLMLHDDREWLDAAVVDQRTGPTLPCPWLEYGTYEPDIQAAYLAGTDPGYLAVPEGWEYEDSLTDRHTWTSNEEAPDLLVVMDDEEAVNVLWDKRDQTVKYLGRAFPHIDAGLESAGDD